MNPILLKNFHLTDRIEETGGLGPPCPLPSLLVLCTILSALQVTAGNITGAQVLNKAVQKLIDSLYRYSFKTKELVLIFQ